MFSACVLKVTPDIRMVHVNTRTVVSHVRIICGYGTSGRNLTVSANDRQSPPQRPFFEIKKKKKKKKCWCSGSTLNMKRDLFFNRIANVFVTIKFP